MQTASTRYVYLNLYDLTNNRRVLNKIKISFYLLNLQPKYFEVSDYN